MNHTSGPVQEHTPRNVVLGTAGHIDHGKTTLVFALTGVDTDRLPEEKQRGITIDLGFAELLLEAADGRAIEVSVVDVPGHHAFVRNMLAGAGGIDSVMLVIAADEGIKAQTIEHLAICQLLGIGRGVVAVTKCDLVTDQLLGERIDQVRRFVHGTFLETAMIVPVSAARGLGIAQLKQELARIASDVSPRGDMTVSRLPLDRAFTIRGFGTVVTGTLRDGTIHPNDPLELQPGGRALRARSLQVHNKYREAVAAPCRVAVNLPGIERDQIQRGNMLVTPGSIGPAAVVDVQVTMLPGSTSLRHGSPIRIHAFTSETTARVLLFDRRVINAGETALSRLRLEHPLVLIPGDRLVLRRPSPAQTVGGAVVLDAAPVPRQRKESTLVWLKVLAAADRAEQLELRIARRHVQGASLRTLRSETGLTFQSLQSLLVPSIRANRIVELGMLAGFVSSDALNHAVSMVENQLGQAGSISRAELSSRTGLPAAVFELALGRLIHSSMFERVGETVRKSGSDMLEPQRNLLNAIDTIYEKAGLAGPLLADVCRELGVDHDRVRESVTLLLRSRQLVRLGADNLLVHVTALENLYSRIRAHRGETFDVSRFKAFTGLTRKHAIPLLEHLDQARVTRNNGGTRVVL